MIIANIVLSLYNRFYPINIIICSIIYIAINNMAWLMVISIYLASFQVRINYNFVCITSMSLLHCSNCSCVKIVVLAPQAYFGYSHWNNRTTCFAILWPYSRSLTYQHQLVRTFNVIISSSSLSCDYWSMTSSSCVFRYVKLKLTELPNPTNVAAFLKQSKQTTKKDLNFLKKKKLFFWIFLFSWMKPLRSCAYRQNTF